MLGYTALSNMSSVIRRNARRSAGRGAAVGAPVRGRHARTLGGIRLPGESRHDGASGVSAPELGDASRAARDEPATRPDRAGGDTHCQHRREAVGDRGQVRDRAPPGGSWSRRRGTELGGRRPWPRGLMLGDVENLSTLEAAKVAAASEQLRAENDRRARLSSSRSRSPSCSRS